VYDTILKLAYPIRITQVSCLKRGTFISSSSTSLYACIIFVVGRCGVIIKVLVGLGEFLPNRSCTGIFPKHHRILKLLSQKVAKECKIIIVEGDHKALLVNLAV